jgi:beta propeller repeat protein
MRVRLIIAGVAALAVAFVALPATALAGTYVEPFTVISGAGNQGEPAVNGSVVLWVDDTGVSPTIQQRYLPASGDPTGPIATLSTSTDGPRHHPAYSAGLATWWDSRYGDGDIWAYSVLSGHEFPVYYGPGEQVEPSTSDGYVVWQDDRNGTWDIWAAKVDPATDAVEDVFPVYEGKGAQTHPVVYGDTVVWQDNRNGTWDIYGARLTGVDASNWTAGPAFAVCTAPKAQTWPSTDGTIVVWQDFRNGNWDIYGATLGIGVDRLHPTVTALADPVCSAFAAQTHPQVAQELAVWQDMRDTQAGASYGADIWARDMGKQTEFPIVVAKGDQVLPSLSYDTVVWEDTRAGDSDVYGAHVTPWSIYVQVGNGSGWTKTRNITVHMLDVSTDVNPPVSKMAVFKEGDLLVPWVPFAPTCDLLLPAGDGPKKVGVEFLDFADGQSPLVWQTIKLDMTPSVTRAPFAATVTKGRTARLPYRVNDAMSPKATVTIRIKTLHGATVKTLSLGRRATGRRLNATFTCTLARKKYRFEVYAKDLAGNQQRLPVGWNYLTVR